MPTRRTLPLRLLGRLQPWLALSVPVADLQTALHLRAGTNSFGPCDAVRVLVHVEELLSVHATVVLVPRLQLAEPGIAHDVSNRVLLPHQVGLAGECFVQHVAQALGFHTISGSTVVAGLELIPRGINEEVSEVASHRALVAHLPEHPVEHLCAQARVLGDESLVLLSKIHDDGAALEQRDGLTVRTLLVHQRRDLPVGV
mmetsp:Transcript_5847/g.12746  ORF Transcript_5847/g.12746 Transcript_5847/m.12746 type:complete len:200 (-) Transcript_5847:399-998(-)